LSILFQNPTAIFDAELRRQAFVQPNTPGLRKWNSSREKRSKFAASRTESFAGI
jgi:hypothetical protein